MQNTQKRSFFVAATSALLICGAGQAFAQFTFGEPENLGPEVNGPLSQSGPSLSADGLELYFSSGASMPGASGDSDLYVVRREAVDSSWGKPQSLGPAVNSPAYEGEPSISTDGLSLYFSDGNFVGPFRRRPGGLGNADIWLTTREASGDEWETPVNVGEPVSSRSMDAGPSLSADGLSLYFASDRPGGNGGMDLWVTRRADAADPWDPPENLGPTVNTSGDDMDPAISTDGRFLFFSSFRTPNFGYIDIWVTTRPTVSDPWREPVNLGGDFNRSTGEWTPALSPDGSTLFFAHWHEPSLGEFGRGGFGQLDLWEMPISAYPPMPRFTVTPQAAEAPVEVHVDGSPSTAESGRDVVSYEWDFGEGVTATGPVAEHTYSRAGRFPISLTVTDERDSSWTTTKMLSVGCPGGDVSPWRSIDVGEPPTSGSARIEDASSNEEFSLCASAGRVSGTEDSVQFLYRELSGDTRMAAQILSLDGGLTGPQVGVMLRESLDADASHAAMALTRSFSESFRFYYRDAKGERSRSSSGPRGVVPPNAWVRIERKGQELIGSVSTDGTTWEEVDRRTIAGFPETYYAGVFAAGGSLRDGTSFEALQTRVSLEVDGGGETFLRGDCNGDGGSDISDAVCILDWLFAGEADPGCVAATNANGDDAANLSDATYLLSHLFSGGPAPVAPFPDCGPVTLPVDAELGCANPPDCR